MQQNLSPQEYIEINEDERQTRRVRVLKKGMLGFGEQYAGQPCIVRDMSEHGAKIEFENMIALPMHFVLHVEIDGFQVECKLIWHKPPHAGVVFTSAKQETTLARKQTLGDAENALSEQFRREFEARERMEQKQSAISDQQNSYRNRRSPKKQFGKRCFEG